MTATGNHSDRKTRSLPAPVRLLLSAGIFLLFFAVVHIAGCRKYTAILSGTASFGLWGNLAGLTYLALFGCAAITAPVLGIAAGILTAAGMLGRRNKNHAVAEKEELTR